MADSYSSRKSRFKWTNNDVSQKKSSLVSNTQKVLHQGSSVPSIKSSQMRSNVCPGTAYQGAVLTVAKEKGHTSASYSRQHKRARVGRFHSNKVWVPGAAVSLKETHKLTGKIESRDHPSNPGGSEPSRSEDVHPTVQSSVTKLDNVPASGVDSRSPIDIKNRSSNNFKRSLHRNRVWKPQDPLQSNVQGQVPASPLKLGVQPKEVCAQSEIQRKHKNLVWRPERVAVTKQPEVTGGTTSIGNQPRSLFFAKSTSKSSRYRWRRRTLSHSKSAESLKSPTRPKTPTQSPYHSLWLKRRKQGMCTTHRRSVGHLKWTRTGGSVKATTPHGPLKPHSARRRRPSFGDKYQNSPEGSVFFKVSQSGSSRSTRFHWVSSLSLKRTHPAGISPLHRSSGKVLASRQIPKLHRRMQRQNRNRVWISARSRVFRRMDQSPHSQMKPARSSNMLSPTLSMLAYSSSIHSPSANRVLASRAIRRSKAYFWSIKQKQLCTYYCRFGKCSRDNCPYVHDKDKIAICPQFLLGVCEKTDGSCLLSHKNDRNKMPVCLFYLRGVCGREDCPYLHVNLGKEAEVCKEFIKGHCVHGEECTKLHAYYCPEYTIYGECARGTDCPLKHRKQARLTVSRPKKSKQAQLMNAKTPKAFKRNKAIEAACDDGGNGDGEEKIGSESSVVALRPLDLNEMPDFIPL